MVSPLLGTIQGKSLSEITPDDSDNFLQDGFYKFSRLDLKQRLDENSDFVIIKSDPEK